MGRMVWLFVDISCPLEIAFPVDPFDGGEVRIQMDGLGNAQHFMQPPLFVGV